MEAQADDEGLPFASAGSEEAEEGDAAHTVEHNDRALDEDEGAQEVRVDETLLEPTYGSGVEELLNESQNSGSGVSRPSRSPGFNQQAVEQGAAGSDVVASLRMGPGLGSPGIGDSTTGLGGGQDDVASPDLERDDVQSVERLSG